MFLFSIFMIIAGLGAAAWLFATGQAGTVDGLFLLLTALLTALVFALYVVFVIHRAMESSGRPRAATCKAKSSPGARQTGSRAGRPAVRPIS